MSAVTITDPALIEQLRRADVAEFRDPEGRVLGRFAAATPAKPPADGVVQPETPPETNS